jgi:hypothetical protein
MENKIKVFENSALVSLNALSFDWIVFVEPSKIRDNVEDEEIELQVTNCCTTNYSEEKLLITGHNRNIFTTSINLLLTNHVRNGYSC